MPSEVDLAAMRERNETRKRLKEVATAAPWVHCGVRSWDGDPVEADVDALLAALAEMTRFRDNAVADWDASQARCGRLEGFRMLFGDKGSAAQVIAAAVSAEREECAALTWQFMQRHAGIAVVDLIRRETCEEIAAAIRARGEAKLC